MSSTRKRSRVSFEASIKGELGSLARHDIDDALRAMLSSNEVVNPTRRRIRRALRSKLHTSKTMIKKHKQTIDSMIDQYWIRPPSQGCAIGKTGERRAEKSKSKSKSTSKSKGQSNSKSDTVYEMSIFSLPDVLQQKIILYLHPRGIYRKIPFVCKWWDYLTMKQDFLTYILHTYLRIECPASPLTFESLLPFLQHCCYDCGNGVVLTKTDVDRIVDVGTAQFVNNEIEFIKVPFDSEYCQHCFETNEKYQAILSETAKDVFKLTNNDLAPIKQQYNPFLFSLKLYARLSDVKSVAIEKFGSLSIISQLTPFEVGSIDKERAIVIKTQIRKLKRNLLNGAIEHESKMETQRLVSGLFDAESDSDEYDASFVNSVSHNNNDSSATSNTNSNTNSNANSNTDEDGNGNGNGNENGEKFEHVAWPTPEMMDSAKKNYSDNGSQTKRKSMMQRREDEISKIELGKDTIKSELETFLSSKEYNHYFGFAFFRGSHSEQNGNDKRDGRHKRCKDNGISLSVAFDTISARFDGHLQRVRQRKWKIRNRSNGSWYQDWYNSTLSNDYFSQR